MPNKKGWCPPFNRELHERSGQYKMWQVMRVLRRFDLRELQRDVEARSGQTVRSYVRALARTGYLRREGSYSCPIYVLVRNTGPYAPQIRHDKTVFDLNKRVAYGEVLHAD